MQYAIKSSFPLAFNELNKLSLLIFFYKSMLKYTRTHTLMYRASSIIGVGYLLYNFCHSSRNASELDDKESNKISSW